MTRKPKLFKKSGQMRRMKRANYRGQKNSYWLTKGYAKITKQIKRNKKGA